MWKYMRPRRYDYSGCCHVYVHPIPPARTTLLLVGFCCCLLRAREGTAPAPISPIFPETGLPVSTWFPNMRELCATSSRSALAATRLLRPWIKLATVTGPVDASSDELCPRARGSSSGAALVVWMSLLSLIPKAEF